MINIQRFVCNPLQVNTFVVSDETGECVIIDCGAYYDNEHLAIQEYIGSHSLRPVHHLLTHGHFDHCIGAEVIYETYGLSPEIHSADVVLYEDMTNQVAYFLGVNKEVPMPRPGRLLRQGDMVAFGSHSLEVIETPGHSPGGLTFYCKEEGVAFCGDTLFRMSIGRTDFDGGNEALMKHSLINVLGALPSETKVYCGHGPATDIGTEMQFNPFVKMFRG